MAKRITRKSLALGLALSLSVFALPAHSIDLFDVYRQALDRDPELRRAEAEFRAAQQLRPQARSALLPQLDAGAGYSAIDRDPQGAERFDYRSLNYDLTLNQRIFDQRVFTGVRQARLLTSEAQAFRDAARQGLILRVAEAYFGVLSAKDNLSFAEAEKEAIGRQLEQSERRFEVGLIAITDVKEAQAQFDLSVAEEIAAQNRLDRAREDLAVITGQYYEAMARLSERMQLVSPEPADKQQWVETALEQNLALAAQRLATERSAEEIKRQRGGHLPTLNLSASYRDEEIRNPSSGVPDNIRDSKGTEIGLRLNVPIFAGGSTVALTREARENFEAAQESLELRQRQTVREARNAFQSVNAGISRVRALEQALESTRAAFEATQAGFEVGTRTAVEVLLELRQVFRAERDFAEARYAYLLDTLRLKQAAGVLTEEDLIAINNWLD
ncbi:outer membrane protein [Ectothiorhodosinus mongolicus]|uniref:Outer membrane protein n=1 Tax=Ectothiorhodosinus mongolicus TaxID=233100 RepID=A0A1R3VQJ7_9GAMM|nr:outer membrane protein [Ectothiorhodosinus mongolicus]